MVANAVPAKSTGAFSNTQCDIMRQFLKSLGSLICECSEMHGLGALAKITLALTDEQICLLIANGQFEEVSKDD
jgi:hypothetical protein